MTLRTRFWLLGLLAAATAAMSVGVAAPAAWGVPSFGVESFVAANCDETHETCVEEEIPVGPLVYSVPKEPTLSEAEAGGYTQAGGHPAVGITAFKINTVGTIPNAAPLGVVTHIRTDVAPGVSTNPTAVSECESAKLGKEFGSGTGFYTAPECSTNTEIGVNKVIVYTGEKAFPEGGDLPLTGAVYNLTPPTGSSSRFGVALAVPEELTEKLFKFPTGQLYVHTFIEGHVEWAGDYHDYYEIIVNPALPLIASRLQLNGAIGTTGKGGFITNPTTCAGPGPLTTNTVALESNAGPATRTYTTPIAPEGCLGEVGFTAPPFEPGFGVTPETTKSDSPDGITTEVSLPHDPSPTGIDSSQLRNATIVLPEGMTLNPSAAQGLTACTPTQFGMKTRNPVECPANSTVGTAQIVVPDLPTPLEGNIYLGGGPTIEKPPYKLYVDAESSAFGISTRLEGTVEPNPSTGRLTTTFVNNPEQPFTSVKLNFGVRGKELSPIANPLTCGTALTETSFVPYTGGATKTPSSAFTVDSNGSGGSCGSSLPFALGQVTTNAPAGGGQASNFTLRLKREDGQQYLSSVSSDLPPGLVGKIPAVPLCPEPAASVGNCPGTSEIGQVSTLVGSGSTPVRFTGPVFLTGPTHGGPYGMTMVVNAAIGPFSLGNVVARAAIEINQFSGRVTVTGDVPTIWAGIPLRLKELVVSINRQGFLINPTNCAKLATESRLGAQQGGTQSVSTPYQATGCSSLTFKPSFGASTGGKTSKTNGASLITKLNFHPKGLESNVKSVVVALPKALPSRTSTLNKACREVVFNANPFNCPSSSRVGNARVKTPVLPGQMSGPAYFVSHGGAKFPDLDIVLTGNGVQIILVGNTFINEKTNVTTTTFAMNPDVPFTGFELNLPSGPKSALGAVGNLCKQSLVMPTTITGQNGKAIKQNTPIAVTGCPVVVLSKFTHNRQAVVTVKAPAAGRVSGSGAHLGTRYKHPGKAKKVTLNLPLTKGVDHRSIRVRIGFLPKNKKEHSSVVYTTVVF
ncbi:MAG: hypothetical protein ACRDK4_10160 [Solirubrobacteraceae bacterium]